MLTMCKALTQTRQVVFEHPARMVAVCQSLVDQRPSYFYIKQFKTHTTVTRQPPSNSYGKLVKLCTVPQYG